MFLLPSIILGVAFALLLGGKPSRILNFEFRYGWTVFRRPRAPGRALLGRARSDSGAAPRAAPPRHLRAPLLRSRSRTSGTCPAPALPRDGAERDRDPLERRPDAGQPGGLGEHRPRQRRALERRGRRRPARLPRRHLRAPARAAPRERLLDRRPPARDRDGDADRRPSRRPSDLAPGPLARAASSTRFAPRRSGASRPGSFSRSSATGSRSPRSSAGSTRRPARSARSRRSWSSASRRRCSAAGSPPPSSTGSRASACSSSSRSRRGLFVAAALAAIVFDVPLVAFAAIAGSGLLVRRLFGDRALARPVDPRAATVRRRERDARDRAGRRDGARRPRRRDRADDDHCGRRPEPRPRHLRRCRPPLLGRAGQSAGVRRPWPGRRLPPGPPLHPPPQTPDRRDRRLRHGHACRPA